MREKKTKKSEKYWFITGAMDVTCEWFENGEDKRRAGVGNHFKSEKEAKRFAEIFKAILTTNE